jgi:hypothetical protein
VLVFFAAAATSCAKGSGEGQVSGLVWAPDCGLEAREYDLNPTFFAMQPSVSVEIIDIVVQRGSDGRPFSDYLSVFVRDPETLKETMLGEEIELGGLAAPVEMTLALNATCPGVSRIPVVYAAVSGTIRFEELFVPWIDNDTQETRAVFTDVVFVDPQDADERRAEMSGFFSFLFERGIPVQPF